MSEPPGEHYTESGPATFRIVSTRTVWAARVNHFDGTAEHQEHGTDQDHATLTVQSIRTHLASLNEPTKRLGGVESCDLVWRHVTDYADGGEYRTAWNLADHQPEPLKV